MNKTNKDIFDTYFGYYNQSTPQSTIDTRKTNVRRFIDYIEDNEIKITDVSDYHIRDYLSHLQTQNLADTTILSHYQGICNLFDFLSGYDKYNIHNITEDIDIYNDKLLNLTNIPKKTKIINENNKTNNTILALDKAIVDKIITHAVKPKIRNELLIRLLWETGIRASECANITKGDIDIDNQKIKIRTAKVTDITKSNAIRFVYISTKTKLLIKIWTNQRHTINTSLKKWDNAPDTDYLFSTYKSKQINPAHIGRIVRKSAIEAGVNTKIYTDASNKTRWMITAHTLRHSHISHHANVLETPIHIIQKLAGHAKIETTMQYVSTDWSTISNYAHKFHQ